MTDSRINSDDIVRKFREIGFAELNESFRDAISKSIEILKVQTEHQLRSTGINVNSPVKSHGRTYQPLIQGVVAEVSDSGLAGRVRVAPASRDGYSSGKQSQFMLKWFEQGTSERFRKPAGRYKAKDKYGNYHFYKREVGQGSTGKIKTYGFFDKAISQTEEDVNLSLERNINEAIQRIWQR